MRYVTTERRGISPKVSRPKGLKRRGPIGCVAPRSRRAQAMLPPRALPAAHFDRNESHVISRTGH